MKNIDLTKSATDSAADDAASPDKDIVSGLVEFADKDEYVDEL
jgi:hypothetical protein